MMFNPYEKHTGEDLLVQGGVLPSQVEDCIEWAFGGINPDFDVMEIMQIWNKRHGDIFKLNKKDSIAAALVSIGKAYCITMLDSEPIDPRKLRESFTKSDPDIRSKS